MSNVFASQHPLVAHKLSRLRTLTCVDWKHYRPWCTVPMEPVERKHLVFVKIPDKGN